MTSSWLLQRVVELAATYLVQSTVFLVGAWALLAALAFLHRWRNLKVGGKKSLSREFDPSRTERAWKLAVVLALMTAPLSVFIGWSHPAWKWSLREDSSQMVEFVSSTSVRHSVDVTPKPLALSSHEKLPAFPKNTNAMDLDALTQLRKVEAPLVLLDHVRSDPRAEGDSDNLSGYTDVRDNEPATLTPAVTHSLASDRQSISVPLERLRSRTIRSWIQSIGVVLVIWLAWSVYRLAMKYLALHRVLARCDPIDGELRHQLNRLTPKGYAIRLLRCGSVTPNFVRAKRINSVVEPFACRLFYWTIVLPAWIERKLGREELTALLAHEVAHLVRRDPWWHFFGEVLCTCFAFQPLNFLARTRWQKATECLCDDWAVEQHVSATSLASCLTRIAEWRLDRQSAAPGLTAVGHSSSLSHRVEWLLRRGRTSEPKQRRGKLLMTLFTFAAGLMVGAYGPHLSLVPSVDAGDDIEGIVAWDDIHRNLTEALSDLAWIDSQLAGDPEAASLVSILHENAASLKHQLSR